MLSIKNGWKSWAKQYSLFAQSGKAETLHLQEAKGLIDILSHYTKSFVLLNQFDSQSLQPGVLDKNITYEIKYEEAKKAITQLNKNLIEKKEATDLFGKERKRMLSSFLQPHQKKHGIRIWNISLYNVYSR